MTMPIIKRYFSKSALAKRYETTTRSIDRWIKSGRFPPPDLRLPSGHGRWLDTTIEAHERTLVTHRGLQEMKTGGGRDIL
jgi:hypothetical protein